MGYYIVVDLTKSSFSVLIIARPNSQSAREAMNILCKDFEAEIVEATTPTDLSGVNFRGAKNVEILEMAISISHHRARSKALRLANDWALILEEDAIINFNREHLELLIQSISNSIKDDKALVGIHLFPEQFGILSGKSLSSFLHVLYLPDFAVGYMLNLNAIKYTVLNFNFNHIEIADWPKYMRKKIKWFSPTRSLVLHPDLNLETTNSSTQVYRDIRASYSILKKLFNFRIFVLFLIRIGSFLNLKHGNHPIESEKIRTVRLYF